MEENRVPWWLRALSFALSGIRSGFGLFSRSQNHTAADEPVIAVGPEEDQEDYAKLIEHSPLPEPIAEAVNKDEAVALHEQRAEVANGVHEQLPAMLESGESKPEGTTLEGGETEGSGGFNPRAKPHESMRTLEPEELESEGGGGFNLRIEPSESPRALAPEVPVPSTPSATPGFFAPGSAETVTETEVESQIEESGKPEPKPALAEPAPQPEPETQAAAEPAVSHKSQTNEDSLPGLAVSSVELNEPVVEVPPEPATGQQAPGEAKSPDQVAPLTNTALETEPAAEHAAVIDPEPAKNPMELNEPVPEQAAEPTAANETAPVVELAASSASPPQTATEAPPEDEMPAADPEPKPAAQHKPFIKLESRDNEADLSAFSVVVSQVYDGPLDLLLDLIRKQDIDIYDIPIARITAQFLAYVNQLKATDVDVAGEFIYTASLLIHIKSKMLLPRAPAGPDDAAEDPRRELVERLLEHERFKNAAQMLQQKQMLEAATWTNPGLREFQDDAGAEPEIAADTVDLVRIFRDILDRARNRPVINVEEDSVTVGQMIQFLSRRLTMEDKPVALRRLLSHTRSERALIAMFLALLELVRLQAILLRQDRAFSEIFIKKHTGFEAIMNEGLANARDDWR